MSYATVQLSWPSASARTVDRFECSTGDLVYRIDVADYGNGAHALVRVESEKAAYEAYVVSDTHVLPGIIDAAFDELDARSIDVPMTVPGELRRRVRSLAERAYDAGYRFSSGPRALRLPHRARGP